MWRAADWVPDIAPAAHGVADYAQEYRCDAGRTPELGERTDSLDALEHLVHLREGLAAHSIEGYAGLLAAGLKVSRPGIIAAAPVTAATAILDLKGVGSDDRGEYLSNVYSARWRGLLCPAQ